MYKVPDGMAVVTTDNKGEATFVAKPNTDDEVKNDNTGYVGSYKYKVKAGNAESETKTLKVAAITYGADMENSVKNLNGDGDYAAIVPGKNVKEDTYAAVRKTTNVNGNAVTYVGAQQVTGTGDSHKVAFQTGVFLAMPATSGDVSAVQKQTQGLNWKSGRYHTYDTPEQDGVIESRDLIKYDLTNVAYATVHVNSLELSRHTTAELGVEYKDGTYKKIKVIGQDEASVKDGVSSIQIQQHDLDNALAIKMALRSEGQVDLDSNVGYDVKDVEFVYESQEKGDSEITYDALDADITWNIESGVYYDHEESMRTSGQNIAVEYHDANKDRFENDTDKSNGGKEFTDTKIADAVVAAIKDLDSDVSEDDFYNITYSVPAFPETGNAIVRCYNKNNTLKKVFTCATIKRVRTGEKNVNILYWDTTKDSKNNLFYEIADKEINTENVGTILEDDHKGLVVVDSPDSGITHLKAVISSDDPEIQKELDVTKSNVYTSIMWNPVLGVSKDNAPKIAFAGQTAEIVAQLVDENGNPVSKGGQPIDWSYTKDSKITEIEKQLTTDPEGRAKLRLKAAEAVELIGLKATTTSGYFVELNDESSVLDIYWIDLGLAYKSSAIADFNGRDADTLNNAGTAAGYASATVGEKWEYASKVVGFSTGFSTKFKDGALKDKTVSRINGIAPTVDKQKALKGTVTENDIPKGSVTVTSTEAVAEGQGAILFRLNGSNDVKDAVVIIDGKEYQSIGSGSLSANETLTLNYVFEKSGSEMEFITNANGNKSAERRFLDDDQVIYLKLRDSYGNPITKLKDNERIRISVNGKNTEIVAGVTAGSINGSVSTANIAAGASAGSIVVSSGAVVGDVNGYVNNVATGKALTDAEETDGDGNPAISLTKDTITFGEDCAATGGAVSSTSKNGKYTRYRVTEVLYGSLSQVAHDGRLELSPNEDGILAIQLRNLGGNNTKENVVVTATYEEVVDGKVKQKTTPVSQSYSFVDAEYLPVFTFDTKKDSNGQNRIKYDTNTNTITLAFTNDLLKESVNAEQFTVTCGGVNYPVESATLTAKDTVTLQLDGKIGTVTAGSIFEVGVGNDFAMKKSVGYLFQSADGQPLEVVHSIKFTGNNSQSIAMNYIMNIDSNAGVDPSKDFATNNSARHKGAYTAVTGSAWDAPYYTDSTYYPDGLASTTNGAILPGSRDITITTVLLTLAGVDFPKAQLKDETLAYLAAIKNQILKAVSDKKLDPSGSFTAPNTSQLNDFLQVTKNAVHNADTEKKALESAIGKPSVDGTTFVIPVQDILTKYDATTTGAAISGPALSVDSVLVVANPGAPAPSAAPSVNNPFDINVDSSTNSGGASNDGEKASDGKEIGYLIATDAAIELTEIANKNGSVKIGELPAGLFNGAPKDLKVKVVVTGTYYVRTYVLELTTKATSNNTYVVTGYEMVVNEISVKDKQDDVFNDVNTSILHGKTASKAAARKGGSGLAVGARPTNDEGIGVTPVVVKATSAAPATTSEPTDGGEGEGEGEDGEE